MSTTIETIILCDRCGEEFGYGHLRNETATYQRQGFRGAGWHRYKGQDICPPCWGDLQEEKENAKHDTGENTE